ncbi:Sec-independent protein translocase TatA [Paracoccus sp. S-4012]|uniref:twin-arginine translocase TatA/TatE family subunit n=1 Tax=Paracoccus sp. S-4012 TaxID=2665648 RepID=UPI0012AF1750|nr:twin-arginine translocase TatA/TatE family subunit [Paracoccus sp. S-4012]MRX51058.1 Sec-independent protein translocase TatA [Paracoccus sp. S-4012]
MLNNIGLPGLLLIAVVVLVLFGRGKVSSLMGEVGKGITAFKRGVNDGAAEYDREVAEGTRTTETKVISASDAEARARDVTPAAERDRV